MMFCALCVGATGFDLLNQIATKVEVSAPKGFADRAALEAHLLLVHNMRVVRVTVDGFEIEYVPPTAGVQ